LVAVPQIAEAVCGFLTCAEARRPTIPALVSAGSRGRRGGSGIFFTGWAPGIELDGVLCPRWRAPGGRAKHCAGRRANRDQWPRPVGTGRIRAAVRGARRDRYRRMGPVRALHGAYRRVAWRRAALATDGRRPLGPAPLTGTGRQAPPCVTISFRETRRPWAGRKATSTGDLRRPYVAGRYSGLAILIRPGSSWWGPRGRHTPRPLGAWARAGPWA